MIRELLRVQDESHPKEPGDQLGEGLGQHLLPVVSPEARDAWYVVVHDLTATNKRLFELVDRQRRHPTGLCASCGQPDTIIHRLTVCGGSGAAWRWLGKHLSRLVGQPVRPEWLTRPDFAAPMCAEAGSLGVARCTKCGLPGGRCPIEHQWTPSPPKGRARQSIGQAHQVANCFN